MMYIWSTNPKNLGSRLIRFGGRDKCSHFAKYYPDRDLIVESRLEHGVRALPFKQWVREGNLIVYSINMPFAATDDELYRADQAILGRRYDRLGVIFMAAKTILRLPFKENKWGSREDLFCVEIISTHDSYLRAIGIVPPRDWENLYPEEAYEYLARRIASN